MLDDLIGEEGMKFEVSLSNEDYQKLGVTIVLSVGISAMLYFMLKKLLSNWKWLEK